MDDTQIKLIETITQQIRIGLIDVWKIYMSWFTWFFGANLLIIGWIFTSDKPMGPTKTVILAGAWLIFNATGLLTLN